MFSLGFHLSMKLLIFYKNMYPIEYKIDKEWLKWTSKANQKYGECKPLLEILEFDFINWKL